MDAELADDTWIPVPEGSPFTAANLPLGIGARPGDRPRGFVAVGDHAIDLSMVAGEHLLDGTGVPVDAFADTTLNRYLAAGPEVWRRVRDRLGELVRDRSVQAALEGAVVARDELRLCLPVAVGDYVDFYSSLHHATNLGRLFRPDAEPLLPNWRHLPVGYHGRSATVVVSGTPVRRPCGLQLAADGPVFGPSASLDLELEVGFVVGVANRLGQPIPVEAADQHLYGCCLVNDWSARDIQAFEYQPLGPFLGKSFLTSVSPWLVGLDALHDAGAFTTPPVQDPVPADYLRSTDPWGLDLELEVLLQTSAMAEDGEPPRLLSTTTFADMYWTPAQQLAHLTVNGALVRVGDLFASGTVSGPERGTEGSLIELSRRGAEPVELPGGAQRSFLEDGDTVVLRGWAGSGDRRIGLGEVAGTVMPAGGG